MGNETQMQNMKQKMTNLMKSLNQKERDKQTKTPAQDLTGAPIQKPKLARE
jgi:hypothetical protein